MACDLVRSLIARAGEGELPIAVDLETRDGHIACIGIAEHVRRAFCIPFLTTSGPYFSPIEEIQIILLICDLLMHPNVRVIGQNYNYDQYYIARRWFFRSRLDSDTMVKQHICFLGAPKGLDFISSIHNDYHCYWKDESKDWDPSVGEAQLWIYNCKDACATFEADGHLSNCVKVFGFEKQLAFQMRRCATAFQMMLRGAKIDFVAKQEMSKDLHQQMEEIKLYVNTVLGKDIGIFTEKGTSPTKVLKLCNEVFKLPIIWKDRGNGTSTPSADDEAIDEWLRSCDPLYRPVLQSIADYRSLLVYKSTFADADVDPDGRFRCTIKPTGAHTLRWATATDPFGYGTNMQNIPKGED